MNSGIHTDRLNFPKEENESRFRMINFLLVFIYLAQIF